VSCHWRTISNSSSFISLSSHRTFTNQCYHIPIGELDRETRSLQREEQRLTIEIKKMARENQMKAVKIMAKDLVRTRQYITKFIEMRSHLQGCALKLQTVASHAAMAEAMKSTAIAMRKMNKAVDVPAINKMMAEFEKENMKSEMMQEIMGEAIDGAMDNDEEEEDRVVAQVLDEIGIAMSEGIPNAPELGLGGGVTNGAVKADGGKVALAAGDNGGNDTGDAGSGGGGASDTALSDLEARLNNLKR
jgi:charged multivesicular body protein 2A